MIINVEINNIDNKRSILINIIFGNKMITKNNKCFKKNIMEKNMFFYHYFVFHKFHKYEQTFLYHHRMSIEHLL